MRTFKEFLFISAVLSVAVLMLAEVAMASVNFQEGLVKHLLGL